MKKYIYLFLFITTFLILKFSNQSYAYEECSYVTKRLNSINSNNLPKYMTSEKITYHKFCSYKDCYNVRDNNIKKAIKDFLKIQATKKPDEYNIEAEIKGIPLTEITFTSCK